MRGWSVDGLLLLLLLLLCECVCFLQAFSGVWSGVSDEVTNDAATKAWYTPQSMGKPEFVSAIIRIAKLKYVSHLRKTEHLAEALEVRLFGKGGGGRTREVMWWLCCACL